MNSFIAHIIKDIKTSDLKELKHHAYVFPTRRACFYFRDALMAAHGLHTFWAPRILSIEDFVEDLAGVTITDEIHLLFELYDIYTATYPPHPRVAVEKEELPTFDRFYAWGQVLLKDFDEVDRYMADPDKLYRNLQELRDIESMYADNEEVLFALKRFNQMIGSEEQTSLVTNFTNQWTRVCKTYHAFKKHLQKNGLRYRGQIYREVAENLLRGTLDPPYKKVIFAGFNALSTSEEVIFEQLWRADRAHMYWDADKWYLDNDLEEAGKFLRRYYRKWPPSESVRWVVTNLLQESKDIRLLGGVQSMGQAQITGQYLETLDPQQQKSCAVILADENLLFPVLYALPASLKKLNVTMGFPLKNSLWFRLINAFLQFQLQIRGRGAKAFYETASLKNLLANSLLQQGASSGVNRMQKKLKKVRSRWVPCQSLLSDDMPATLKLALSPQERVAELLKQLRELLVNIYHSLRLAEDQVVESEFAYHSIKHLRQLEQRMTGYSQKMEPKTLVKLVSEAFQQAKVPFSGEPIGGVQLMGFLETRALDFEHLYILSVNEGKLPRGPQHNSYIPYAVRKAFKLPTFEEQDAIYAYHFKRIMQRAAHVSILYNTEVAIDGSGEKSRFLWQLQQAYPRQNIKEQIFQMPLLPDSMSTALTIEKTPAVQALMNAYVGSNAETKALSATGLRHYLDCSLRFYFIYVIRLPEREEISLELDPREFGNVVHSSLEKIYRPWIGKTVTRDHLKELMASEAVIESVNTAFQEYYRGDAPTVLEGKDVLHQQIVQKLVFSVLRNDLKSAPFNMIGTEYQISENLTLEDGRSFKLKGTLDRVLEHQGTINIVDYKTGKVDMVSDIRPHFPDKGAAYVSMHFEQPKFKAGFQGFYYGYLWHKQHPEYAIKVGVYPLKKVNDGIQWLNGRKPIPGSGFKIFEEQLVKTIQQLFDVSIPFTQTPDIDNCRFCAYKEICQR